MAYVKIYTSTYCPYCIKAKSLMDDLGIEYEEIDVGQSDELRKEIVEKYNWMTVPVIIAGEECLGGYDDIANLHYKDELLPKLTQE